MERRARVVCLDVDELEPQRRREVLEHGKPVPQCHRLQDEAVLVDEPEPGERLRERGAAPDRRGSGSLPGIRSLCEHRW